MKKTRYTKDSFPGKKCTVLGLGVSNRPLIDYLLSHGAVLEARDKKRPEDLGEYAETLRKKGVVLIGGDNYLKDLSGDFIFRSPGIRPDAGDIPKAVGEGSVLLSETELFFELCPCPIIALTGSDGKTTSTTLTAKLLEKAGRKVWLGGNIGIPLIQYADVISENDVAVMELSSFQLMTFRRSANSAAITNISPNHLDWHTGMDEYVNAKSNIFRHSECRKLVLNANDGKTDYYRSLFGGKNIVTFSAKREADVELEDGYITLFGEKILKASDIIIPGVHNIENYMTAIALTRDFGVTNENIKDLATTFPGVSHRLEFIRELDGVRYYNSSIDSTPSRTEAALSAISNKPIIICGGYDKHIPFAPLAKSLEEKAKKVVLTGATARLIEEAIKSENADVDYVIVDDFKKAVEKARELAKSGDIVLLSPACASFDRFKNFEERGNFFRQIVEQF